MPLTRATDLGQLALLCQLRLTCRFLALDLLGLKLEGDLLFPVDLHLLTERVLKYKV